jgi:signal transduction histidine kinase
LTVAFFFLVMGLATTMELGEGPTQFSREEDIFHIGFIVLLTVPLALRRVYPVPVFAIVLLAWVTDRGLDYPETSASAGVAIAFYTIGAELERRRSFRIGGTAAAVIVGWTGVGVAVLESVPVVALLNSLIATLTPLLVGREIHERRRRVEELEERASRAEQEREERARQAVSDERTRIARELHDVVAHQMTVMTLQAEGASRIASDADPRIAEALETIRHAGHEALAELRRTVGLLRTTDDDPEIRPLPRLADVGELVEQIKAAGVPVEIDIQGDPRPLADGAELSAYRVVQESLTNALRHAGPNVTARVSIAYGENTLDVSITDDGRGSSSRNDNDGHGIIGMRERVTMLGGEFDAGPKQGGGFKVHATIPLEK